MSLEAITKIRGVEEEMDQARTQARAQAQKILTYAEQAGQERRRSAGHSAAMKSWLRQRRIARH